MQFKLAVNYLSEVKELFEEGKLEFIDYFKLYSLNEDLTPMDWCIKNGNVLFHGFDENGSFLVNHDLLEKMNIDKVKEYIKITNTPYISAHLEYSNKEIYDKKQILKNVLLNIEKIRDIFNKDIIIENVPYKKGHEIVSNPDFISEVIEKTNCDFLFDISHARKTASWTNVPFNEYVNRLPMKKIREIHLSGCILDNDGRIQAPHSKMNEEDYKFLQELINKRNNLKVITLEYGVNKEMYKNEENILFPLCSFNSINLDAKREVYYQLTRIKEIIKR